MRERFTARKGSLTVIEEGNDYGDRVKVVDGDWDENGNPRTTEAENTPS